MSAEASRRRHMALNPKPRWTHELPVPSWVLFHGSVSKSVQKHYHHGIEVLNLRLQHLLSKMNTASFLTYLLEGATTYGVLRA